ncbi:MAG TPA: metal-dependent hydrolase [Thermoanaerobaculia bacterium]
MDTISHGIAGSILGRSLAERSEARAALVVGAVAAMVPDLDAFFLATRLDYLRDHRSWTHSFLVLPFFALGLALLAKLFARRARLGALWVFAAIGLASHIFFDWITSFGIMFWTPVSRTRYALDWIFILDPYFTAIGVATLIFVFVDRERGRRIAAAGSALLFAYGAFCAVQHGRALEAWRRLDAPPADAKVAVIPQFLSPFRWMGLSERPDSVHLAFFDIGPFASGSEDPRPPKKWTEILQSLRDYYPPPARARIQSFERPPSSPALEAARALPDIAVYLAFARFPLETVYPSADGGAEVIVQDLRFLPFFTGPWERGGEDGIRRQPFVYRIRLDGALRAIERGFVSSGRR